MADEKNGKAPGNMGLIVSVLVGIGTLAGWVQIELSHQKEELIHATTFMGEQNKELRRELAGIEDILNSTKFAMKSDFDEHRKSGGVEHPYALLAAIDKIEKALSGVEAQFRWQDNAIQTHRNHMTERLNILWEEIFNKAYPQEPASARKGTNHNLSSIEVD